MSIGLYYQRLSRQTTGQQTVRPCNNVSSSPFPFIAALPAGRCSPPALPAMWLQTPRCTTGLPHRRGDWCDPSAMRPYAPGHCPQTAPYSSGCCGPWRWDNRRSHSPAGSSAGRSCLHSKTSMPLSIPSGMKSLNVSPRRRWPPFEGAASRPYQRWWIFQSDGTGWPQPHYPGYSGSP